MIVGVDTDTLRGPMTGIANYTLNGLRAVLAAEPELQITEFRGVAWQDGGSGALSCSASGSSERAADEFVSRTWRAAQSKLLECSRRSTQVRRIYRGVRRSVFESTLGARRLDLWHAVSMLMPSRRDVPVLPVVYDLSCLRFPEAHPPDRVRQFERLGDVVQSAARVQTISNFTRNEIARTFGYAPDRIVVAPPAARDVFRPLGRGLAQRDIDRLGLRFGGYFLVVGTLEPRKNLRTVIDAYARLTSRERSHFPLLVVGGAGWGNLELPPCTRSLIAEQSLRFLGFVPDALLRSLYEGARLMLYPSVYEGFGMPVVEALACGAGVAHGENTAMDEISAGLAARVCARDVGAWTEVMRTSMDAQEDETSRAARIAQSRTFSWARTGRTIARAYRDVAAA